MTFKQHALSSAFPAMSADEFDALVADIAANGQRDPIIVFEGDVIDGWHRYSACLQLGIEVLSKAFSADADPVAFVLSRNLHRRHLTASQRAMAVAACAKWLPEGRPGNSAAAALFPDGGKSLASLADDAGVSRRTMAQAAKVVKEAAPEVAKAVRDGDLTAERAAEIAALPKDAQPAAVHAPKPAAPKKAAPQPATDELQAQLSAQAEQLEALAKTARELLDENAAMAAVFDADDKLAEQVKQNKQLRAEVSALRERVNGLMNEKNAAIRAANQWKRKADAVGAAA